LGTETGVLRFDGVRFIPAAALNLKLANPLVLRLLATTDGALWIATRSGLGRWKDGVLTAIPELADHVVTTVIEGHDGTIWAGTSGMPSGEPARLCSIHDMRANCDGANGAFGQLITTLFENTRGELWVGAMSGLWHWNTEHPVRYALRDPAPEIHSIVEMDDGSLLISISRDVVRLHHDIVETFSIGTVNGSIKPTDILRDNRGGLWFGTQDHGLVHLLNRQLDRYDRADGLSASFVAAILQDREGNVWTATAAGLDQFWRYVVAPLGAHEGLPTDGTNTVVASRAGGVWIGTLDGPRRWRNGALENIVAGGFPADVAASMFEDRDGTFWVSSLAGLWCLDHGRFTQVRGIPSGHVQAIAQDTRGDMWVAHQERGLFHLRGREIVDVRPWDTLGGSIGRALLGDANGGLWIGFDRGGIAYLQSGRVINTPLPGSVAHLYLDAKNVLWASTSEGLVRSERGATSFLRRGAGLACEAVHWTIQDDRGGYWLYTDCGLLKFDPAAFDAPFDRGRLPAPAKMFGAAAGVELRTTTGGYSPKVTKTADGHIWFATVQGVRVVDPGDLPYNEEPPVVHIDAVTIDGDTHAPASLSAFHSSTRRIGVDYTALSFVDPANVRFRYALEGYDRDWIDAENNRQAFYTNLPPGHYRFKVIAANASGVWNTAGSSWAFTVEPAFYQTNSFKAAVAVLFLALLFAAHRMRLRRVAATLSRHFDERLAERTRVAQDLHDTLLQGMLGIAMQLGATVHEFDGRPASKLQRIAARMREVVEEGRRAVDGLREQIRDGRQLEAAFWRDVNDLKRERRVDVHFQSIGSAPAFNPAAADDVHNICREAVANAFRHAQPTRIDVTITYSPFGLDLVVVDDGVGFEPERVLPSGHWGIVGMRERAKRIDGTLDVRSHPNIGCSVVLRVPRQSIFVERAGRRYFHRLR